jgi:hypothetical protein
MNVSVRMTSEQLDSLIKLFDDHFVGAIRSNETVQDMAYICEMADLYNRLKKAQNKAATQEENEVHFE